MVIENDRTGNNCVFRESFVNPIKGTDRRYVERLSASIDINLQMNTLSINQLHKLEC
jgi:hypothetical protein